MRRRPAGSPARLLRLCLLVALAGACGGQGRQPGSRPETAGAATLEVDGVWTGREQDDFRQVLDAFQRKSGVRVTYVAAGDDIATVLGTRIRGGSPPDLALLPQPGLLADLAGRGSLVPLEEVAGHLVDENYAPVWRNLATVKGRLYGVWWKASNKSVIWYNVHAFRRAGVRPPRTWAELLAAAGTLSDSGVTPFSVAGADGWTLTDWFENVYLRRAGPEAYDRLARHDLPWTDPSVLGALSTLAGIFGRPGWIAGGTAGALQTDFPTSVEDVFGAPLDPRAAMVYEGDFVLAALSGGTPARAGADAGAFEFPSIGGSPPCVVAGGDVAVLMKDSEPGRRLLRFLASPESAAIAARLGGFTSPAKTVSLDLYPDDGISRRLAGALVAASVAGTLRFDLSDLQPASFGSTVGQGELKLLQDFLQEPARGGLIAKEPESAAERAWSVRRDGS